MNGSPPQHEVHFGEHLSARGHWWRSLFTSGPGVGWVLLFLVVPLMWVGLMAFLTRTPTGGFGLPLTTDNFKRFFGFGFFGFDFGTYPLIILRSLMLGMATTLLCILTGLPLAFFIAGLPPRYRTAALTLVLIPFWTNLLIRTYAWQILLAPESPLTRLAAVIGLVTPGEPLYPSLLAIYIGMICDYLPFMVLPLYASVEKIDWSIAEAAMDLGADAPRMFWHAVLPQIMPGLVAGVVLVFIPASGQFVIPDLLGGAKTMMLGNVIQQQFGPGRDWPFGSAIAISSMALVMIGLWWYARYAGRKGGELL